MRINPISNYQGAGVNYRVNYKVNVGVNGVNQNSHYNGHKITPANKPDTFEKVSFMGKPQLTAKQVEQMTDLKVFNHHIYEFKKGIRTLILTTEKSKHKEAIQERLEREKIDYVIHDVDDHKINVYFGEKPCVDVVKTLNPKLSEHTPQEDFMLGILLGYDKVKQCERYLNFRERAKQRWTQ